jgi:tryptophan 2,3-dioxygenase
MPESGNTLQMHLFDQFITDNYSNLYQDTKKILWSKEYKDQVEDVLHSNILKVRERIQRSGFTNSNLYGYVWASLSNNLKKLRRDNNKIVYSFDSNFDPVEDFQPATYLHVEKYYQEQQHCSQPYLQNLEIFSKYSFRYVDIYYGEKNATLWKTHILHKQTHKQISLQSGISRGTIKNILTRIRKDLQLNIINYINYLTKEDWKPVKHYENLYQVSNKKRLRNRFNKIINPDYKDIYQLWNKTERKYKSMEQIFSASWNANQELRFNRIIWTIKKKSIK